MNATEALILICRPGVLLCPVCEKPLLRQHTGAGWRFDHCDRKRPAGGTTSEGRIRIVRCNTHLFINRGRGDSVVIVSAIQEADKDRLIRLMEEADASAA